MINEYLDDVRKFRRELHQIPEIGFELFKTSEYIKKQLVKMGYVIYPVAKTGVIAIKDGIDKKAIAFRADMDALMVEEKTGVDFTSLHHGQMHACGHDGHMAILLGFAKYLSTIPTIKQTIMLIFQPAEEGPGGAKVIIQENNFKRYQIQAIFAIHLYPGLEEGKFGLVNGAMMAQNGEFDITISGLSSHGALPHLGSDAIVAAAHLITNYQNIISRNIDPLLPTVITIGMIQGGEAPNIIPQQVTLAGTIRCFDPEQYEFVKKRMHEIDKGLEITHRIKINNVIEDYYPPVINDFKLFTLAKEILSLDEYQIIKPMMVSEDFSIYQQVVPGLFVMLGTRGELMTHPLHSCYFNFNETVLLKGIEFYLNICRKMNII